MRHADRQEHLAEENSETLTGSTTGLGAMSRWTCIRSEEASCAWYRPGFYDIIVSDSFLPRFRTNEIRRLLRAWHESLSPAGSIVLTTVRLPRTSPDSSHQYARRLNRWLRVAGEARPRWSELSDLPHEELARRISVFVANQERKTVLDVPTLHSLFKEAGFDCSTIATHNYRGREFALVEAHKGRV